MPWKVSARVRDIDGESSTLEFYLDSATAPASVETAAQSILQTVDVLIGGIIESVSAALIVDMTGWTLKSTALDYDKLQGGRFFFNAANGQVARVTLPTFEQDVYVPAGSENIDTANADVTAFLTAFLGAATVSNVDSELQSLQQAYETFGGKK